MRDQPSGRIYSLGYEGCSVDDVVGCLARVGVSLVVDVRLTPRSRKPGFSKRALAARLLEAGIGYRHEADLGNPRDNREAFRRGNREEGRRRLRALLDERSGSALRRLADDAQRRHVAVLCFERDRFGCHRQLITEMVQEIDPAIEVLPIS